jgi:hypothetical protein
MRIRLNSGMRRIYSINGAQRPLTGQSPACLHAHPRFARFVVGWAKGISTALLFASLSAMWLLLHGCTLLTSPIASAVIGGAQLAIKGAELQKEIRKADAQLAVDTPFEKAWDASLTVLVNLDIEGIRSERTTQGDGRLFGGMAKKTNIKVVVVRLTEEITEFGIWASHDKALADLICERIKEEALEAR